MTIPLNVSMMTDADLATCRAALEAVIAEMERRKMEQAPHQKTRPQFIEAFYDTRPMDDVRGVIREPLPTVRRIDTD